jgi:hypothetical protein
MNEKISGIFTGISGVHYVVSELSRRGLVALPTIRNCAGIDVLVSDPTGNFSKVLQIKTSKDKVGFWPCGAKEHYKGKNYFFIFLRWLKEENRYDVFLEKGNRVVQNILENDNMMKKRKNKAYGKWQFFVLPRDKKAKEKLRQNWKEFGCDQKFNVTRD